MGTYDNIVEYRVFLTPLYREPNHPFAYGGYIIPVVPTEITEYTSIDDEIVITKSGEDYDDDSGYGVFSFNSIRLTLDNRGALFSDPRNSLISCPNTLFPFSRDLSKITINWYNSDGESFASFSGIIDESCSVEDVINHTVVVTVIEYRSIFNRINIPATLDGESYESERAKQGFTRSTVMDTKPEARTGKPQGDELTYETTDFEKTGYHTIYNMNSNAVPMAGTPDYWGLKDRHEIATFLYSLLYQSSGEFNHINKIGRASCRERV